MKRLLLALLLLPSAASAQVQLTLGDTSVKLIGKAISSTDHTTEKTDSASHACRTVKNGTDGTFAGSVAEVSDANQPGTLAITLAADDVDTAGTLIVRCTATGMDPVDAYAQVGFADGVTTSESGTTLGLASGAVDADDQFTEGFAIYLFNASGPVGSSCIVDSTDSGDTIVTAVDLSALHTTGDRYILRPDGFCRVKAELASLLGTGGLTSVDMIRSLYQRFFHKAIDNRSDNELSLYKADGSTKLCESPRSDSGTAFTLDACAAAD